MAVEKKYQQEDVSSNILREPNVVMKTFASAEEADLYRLKRNLAKTHTERFQTMLGLMRMSAMLANARKTTFNQ